MVYRFIDDKGTFVVKNPQKYSLYFPLTNSDGSLLSAISPNLGGDIKKDNAHFLTLPAGIEDIKSNFLCRRDFFIKTQNETIRLSRPYSDTLEAGFLYHKLSKETKSLHIEVLNFIPHNLKVEVMRVKVVNKGRKEISITPTSFIPLYGRAQKNLRDHRHVSSLLNRVELDKYGIFLKPTMVFDEMGHSLNETIYFVLGYEGKFKAAQGQFPTLEYFYGAGDIISPDAIEKGLRPLKKKSAGLDGKEACAAFRFSRKKLKKNEAADYFLVMGMEEDKDKIKEILRSLDSPAKIEKSLQETKEYWQGHLSGLDFDFKDKDFNNWLRWVKLQPVLRKLFGCSFLPHFDYGKGGRGWRDLWQDILTLLLIEPDKAKDLLVHNFKGVKIDGSNATIITKEGGFISDRNNIGRVWMDHGIWPFLTLKLYIHKTGDLNILLEEATYFRDHRLKRAREIDRDFSQSDYYLRAADNCVYKGSVLEHILVQNLTSFFNVGRHDIIRLEGADWNDGLDMAFEEGESVAFSFMYASNLRELCSILQELKKSKETVAVLKELMILLDRPNSPIDYSNYTEKQKKLDEYLEKVKNISGERVEISIESLISDLNEKAEHLSAWLREKEWLEEGFFNGYYDNKGNRVEGKINGDVRMMLAPQVFAIMSGVASEEQIGNIWISIKKYLQDKKLGGFRLNTNFGSHYLDLGRAFGFSYGDKENGAFFNHMCVMLANALYRRGFAGEAAEAFDSIYRMAKSTGGEIYPLIPEYFNREGKGLYLYLTGSASWYIYTLIEEILGIKFVFGDILIKPQLIAANFFDYEIKTGFSLGDKKITLTYRRQGKGNVLQIKEVFFNGIRVLSADRGYMISREALGRENIIEACLE